MDDRQAPQLLSGRSATSCPSSKHPGWPKEILGWSFWSRSARSSVTISSTQWAENRLNDERLALGRD